ncbi:MAG: hypothetical protein RIS47_1967, partial [Bacteroidota bacterium]
GFQIIVSDTGIGIPADKSPRIFDRFYRVSTKNLSVEGMGIGLSLVKEFVELMEGIITLESKLNFGSIFTIVLPYYAEEVSANPEEHNLERLREKVSLFIDTGEIRKEFRSRNQGQHSILIAEDNPEMLNLLSNTLGEHYHILSATNGKEALSLIKKHSPDLVISDVMMPIMGGLELCKNIKSSITTSHIPVILLTAKVLIENQIEGLEIGAEEYLLKPFHPNILLAKVENLLTIRDKYRQLYNTAVSSQDNPDGITPLDAEFLKKLEVFTEANYADPEFNIDRIADSLFVSRSLLYKKLKALTDLSPNDFITVFRLKKAVKLLGENKLSINEVAYSIGFNDPKYFSRVFRKYYKMSPSDFSAQNTKDASK